MDTKHANPSDLSIDGTELHAHTCACETSEPSLARDRAPSFESHDLRRYRDVEVPRELISKLQHACDDFVAALKVDDTWGRFTPHQADSIFAASTNFTRLHAELVRYTHEQVGLPVPPDVIELLDHSPAPGRVAASGVGEGRPTRCLQCDNDIETGGCRCDRPIPSSPSSVAHTDLQASSAPTAV